MSLFRIFGAFGPIHINLSSFIQRRKNKEKAGRDVLEGFGWREFEKYRLFFEKFLIVSIQKCCFERD